MKKVFKVLSIGQLPKEVGGNYTTGIAKVVYELSKQKYKGMETYLFATNINESNAKKICNYRNQYIGYKYLLGRMLCNMFLHPIETIRQWRIYLKEDRVNPLRFEFYKANFERIIKEINPDIIHYHGAGLSAMYFARKDKRIPIVLTCHGVFQREINPNSHARKYAHYVTGLTAETRHEISKYFCVPDDKITIIPNGVDINKFYYSESFRIKKRQEYGVNDKTVVFLTVASVQKRKGQLNFTKIIKNLKGDWQYWIIGKGPEEKLIEQFAVDNNLSDRIKLLGYRNSDELYKYYSAADVYVHASTMEGQALCEIEAYTTGLRTVVNSLITGTVANNVFEDTQGYYVMNFGEPNMADLEKWIGLDGYDRKTRKNFDWGLISNKYLDLYYDILKRAE